MKNLLISILALFAVTAHAADPGKDYRVQAHQFRMAVLEDFYQAIGYTPPIVAAYISANGTTWSPWNSVIAGGQIGYTPTNKVALYCQATATSAWAPCNPGGGTAIPSGPAGGDLGGTYPNPTVTGSHIVSGTINGASIGATTPSTGSFTTIVTTGNITTSSGATVAAGIFTSASVGSTFGNYNASGNVISYGLAVSTPAMTLNATNGGFTGPLAVFQEAGVTRGQLTNNGSYSGPGVIFTGTAPTMVAGAAAGTAPTCTSITGTNAAFVISCTTGTAPTTGTLATITFNGTLPTAPQGCSLTPRNAAASLVTLPFTTAPSTTTWTIGIATALVLSTTYSWSGVCI